MATPITVNVAKPASSGTETPATNLPQTGDSAALFIYATLLALIGIALLILNQRKRIAFWFTH